MIRIPVFLALALCALTVCIVAPPLIAPIIAMAVPSTEFIIGLSILALVLGAIAGMPQIFAAFDRAFEKAIEPFRIDETEVAPYGASRS